MYDSFWPLDCSTPGFPVLHYCLEFPRIHVHFVSDAIQPSHPLLTPFSYCPPSFPASGSFPICCLFASAGQSIGDSTSVSQVGYIHIGLGMPSGTVITKINEEPQTSAVGNIIYKNYAHAEQEPASHSPARVWDWHSWLSSLPYQWRHQALECPGQRWAISSFKSPLYVDFPPSGKL